MQEMMMPRPILICLLLCLLLLLPTWGDPTDGAAQGACYMGYGKMLEAAKSRQLSLNAHVQQFLYQPGGLGIAYQGVQTDGDDTTTVVRLVGVKKGTTTTLVSTTSHTEANADQENIADAPYGLSGWSGDGRYLLLSQERFVVTPDGGHSDEHFACVDVGVVPPHFASIDLPAVEQAGQAITTRMCQYWWSPDRTRLLFVMQARLKGEDRSVHSLYVKIYDPKSRNLLDVTPSEGQVVRGWLDSSRLLLADSNPQFIETVPSAKTHYVAYDLATGIRAAIPTPRQMPTLPNDMNLNRSAASPTAAYMTLEDEPHHIEDQQKVGAVDAHALWIRRTQGPKLMSAAPVGLTPGNDAPQAAWSPTGAQIAFVSHGDLFVTDLTIRVATAIEKYKAGETLTCEEERQLAANNLKQVGLGLLQYSQDYDENFPPADHWQDSVMPYVKDPSVFNPVGHPVVYRAPANLSLASINEVATTVLGYIDLPCATVTLYVDGHVKSVPKGNNGPAAGR